MGKKGKLARAGDGFKFPPPTPFSQTEAGGISNKYRGEREEEEEGLNWPRVQSDEERKKMWERWNRIQEGDREGLPVHGSWYYLTITAVLQELTYINAGWSFFGF